MLYMTICHFLQDKSNINLNRKKKWLPKYSFPSISYEEVCHLMLADEDEEKTFKLYFTVRIQQTLFHLNYFVNSLVVPLLTLFGTSA